jgi:hypothetical protein
MTQVPAGDFFENNGGSGCCYSCGAALSGNDLVFFDGEQAYCGGCAVEVESEFDGEAEEFALRHCRITASPRPYEEWCRDKPPPPTPGEYEAGIRECGSDNAYMAYCRHNCTNYDRLLSSRLDKSIDAVNHVVAIKRRIHELMGKAGWFVELDV